MDIEVIPDAAEVEVPTLRDVARRFLEAEARHLGVPLDLVSVMARRAEGEHEVHIPGAADRLLEHLEATEADPFGDESAFMALARAGAQALRSAIELDGNRASPVAGRLSLDARLSA